MEGPHSVGTGERMSGMGGAGEASPVLSGQSLIWNCASFSLGMSFHVARNICRSTGEEDGVRDGP